MRALCAVCCGVLGVVCCVLCWVVLCAVWCCVCCVLRVLCAARAACCVLCDVLGAVRCAACYTFGLELKSTLRSAIEYEEEWSRRSRRSRTE